VCNFRREYNTFIYSLISLAVCIVYCIIDQVMLQSVARLVESLA